MSSEQRPRQTRRSLVKGLAACPAALASLPASLDVELPGAGPSVGRLTIPKDADRVWVGPECWANRLQDWCVRAGRIECVQGGAMWPYRTLHLLTRRLGPGRGEFNMTVRTGLAGPGPAAADAATGFLIGAGGESMDYRAAALIHHVPGPGGGLFAGVDGAGRPFIRDFTSPAGRLPLEGPVGDMALPEQMILRLSARETNGNYSLQLAVSDAATGRVLGMASRDIAAPPVGNVALVSHPGSLSLEGGGRGVGRSSPSLEGGGRGVGPASPSLEGGGRGVGRYWFEDWELSGAKVEEHPERECGPILSTLYTVQNGVLKLTAQMMPLGPQDSREARLEVRRDGAWHAVATAGIVEPGFTAAFRVEKWNTRRDVPFRVTYELKGAAGKSRVCVWPGTVKRDPTARDTIVVASMSCVQQIGGGLGAGASYAWKDRVWFPHADMTPNVAKHRPDLYFFAGDQIYEGNPTRPVRQPAAESELDYLYKWYLWCWAFRDLVRDTPCVCIPDDHDVYQGNVWGAGGNPSRAGDPGGQKGGYGMPPRWLNMMQRTQTGHLPDPYDPAPAAQGIGVYYTSLTLGGIGFAILEDRKFKSPPTLVKAEMTADSHIIEKGFDTRKADVPGAELLGERQLRFLKAFAADWRGQEMKAVLSQTIFCNLQISSRGETVGELDQDLDSGGWPQSGRNAALREMRRGFMVHLAGDQHLASVVHHGADDWEDAAWSLCSPAVANLYERYWTPGYPPQAPRADAPANCGRYEDGFHNRMTVQAVANPNPVPRPGQFPDPVELHRKATGYAVVRFNKAKRTITFEVWPRFVDPGDPRSGGQYPGWPVTLRQEDNYARKPAAYLPDLVIEGVSRPVVTIIDERDGERLYTLRLRGKTFRPWVFAEGVYTVQVADPERPAVRRLQGVRTLAAGEKSRMEIRM